jgi:hypothetical protein
VFGYRIDGGDYDFAQDIDNSYFISAGVKLRF